MNNPNKRIDVNLSSLLSLKAELVRKHNEVSQSKVSMKFTGVVNPNAAKPSKKRSGRKESAAKPKSKPKETHIEDEQMLLKSKKVLQAKSKFYDKMMAAGGSLNSDDTCLVMFSEKKAHRSEPTAIMNDIDEGHSTDSSSSDESQNEYDDRNDDALPDDEQWVEYTDCLGRTRKCLRKDLELFKKKDQDLTVRKSSDEEDSAEESEKERLPPKVTGLSYMHPNPNFALPLDKVSKLEEMRKNWEQKELENASREEIHYQDVLFDEARTHGVGYYQFSHDEEERAKQQKQLQSERRQTEEAQRQRELLIKNRDKIIAERVRAAKNRQRARLGLPPLEDEPAVDEAQEKREKKAEEKRKRKETEKQSKLEAEERSNAKIRRLHLRPWDEGKSDDQSPRKRNFDDSENETKEEWKYKPEKEPMSQEKWVALQRETRNKEFAPPSATTVTQTAGHSSGRPSFDYFNNYKIPVDRNKTKDIESSIEAGLRFLRDQSDKGSAGNKYTWTEHADY